MMHRRTIRITAIVLVLVVYLVAIAGWDIVFDRLFTAEWPPHNLFF